MFITHNFSNRALIKILIVLFSVSVVESCDYLTGPEKYYNKTAQHTMGGVSLKDYNTGETYSDGRQITGSTKLIIVPDSSINQVSINSFYIDSVLLGRPNYSGNYWVTPNQYYQCIIHVSSNNILQFSSVGGWSGIHTIRIICKLTSANSGLEAISPERNIIEMKLKFF